MTDSAKAKLILKILSTQEIKLQGAREAFAFTEAYQWLIKLAKEMEKEQNVNK